MGGLVHQSSSIRATIETSLRIRRFVAVLRVFTKRWNKSPSRAAYGNPRNDQAETIIVQSVQTARAPHNFHLRRQDTLRLQASIAQQDHCCIKGED